MNYARICLMSAAALVISTPAFGQATRTWVSGSGGNDANPCSRTAPCQTFAGAISKTAAGGEINVIDAGGFGTVNITKNITIDGLGPMSSALNVNTSGIIVNGAGIVVNLRNLTINGANGTTSNGIRILNAAEVNIDNVVIENQQGVDPSGRGVTIDTTTAGVRVNIQNSRFVNINSFGVDSNPSAGNVLLSIENTSFVGGGATAIALRRNTAARLNRVSVMGHPGAAVSLIQSTASAQINDSYFGDNTFGIFNGDLGGAPITRLSRSVITGSTNSALAINGGQVLSHGDNTIRGNAGNELPTAVETPR